MKSNFNVGYIFILCAIMVIIIGCVDTINSTKETDRNDISEDNTHTLDIMTWNIRGDKTSDGVNQWQYRKERVVELISRYNPSILGLQEAKSLQLAFLEENLKEYAVVGGGNRAGEYTVILFDSTKVEYVEDSAGTIWLSETPYEQSRGWDAEHVRILIFAEFTDIKTGDNLFVFNTHFDHRGSESRYESAKLVISTIKEVAEGSPVILMGDFNLTEDSMPYTILTYPNSNLKNSYYETKTHHRGPTTRSAGFSVDNHSNKKPIDFIFINDKISVLTHSFLTDSYNGNYLSDHLPVLVEIAINRSSK